MKILKVPGKVVKCHDLLSLANFDKMLQYTRLNEMSQFLCFVTADLEREA